MPIVPGTDAGTAPEAAPRLAMPTFGMLNQPPMLGLRRTVQLDDMNRVSSQFAHDRGTYIRPPVGPVEYGEGNIKKSTVLTGPAGYNQRNVPLPLSPDDMSQAEYMFSLTENNPETRLLLQKLTALPKQTMLNTPSFSDDYPYQSSNTIDNLLALAKLRKEAK